jgi:predicted metal-dependent phosphoesterase TrpH
MIRVEFHCHTIYSKDSLSTPEQLVETCRRKGIDKVVITDHNRIAGALAAREIDPQRVIIGEEIKTQNGELLAAFVQEEVPKGLPPLETIQILRDQGAFISVSHPFDIMRNGHWQEADLLDILPYVDAIETFNARCMGTKYNARAREFALQHSITGTAGSDAHALFELGKAAMLMPDFKDAESLLQALHEVQFDVSLSAPWVHFTSRYAVWRKSLDPEKYRKFSATP